MRRHNHNLSYEHKFTAKMGQVIHCGLTEVLPGDIINAKTTALIRTTPLVAPVMHPVHVDLYKFFVPTRIAQTSFTTDFITGGPDGDDATEWAHMLSPADTGYAVGSHAHRMGIVPGVAERAHSAHPVRGFNLIYNTFIRDQDLQPERVTSLGDGLDTTTDISMPYACWKKDKFTTMRLEPQKGPDIYIPLGDSAPVSGIGFSSSASASSPGGTNYDSVGTIPDPVFESGSESIVVGAESTGSIGPTNRPQVLAVLSESVGITVNAFRALVSTQRFQERRQQTGTRYAEFLASWGVSYSDATLQRPQFMGHTRQTIQFSEVLQTSESTEASPLGELGGHGIVPLGSRGITRHFEEHGFIHTLMIVRPVPVYANAMEKHWFRRTKEDYWNPEYEHIGQEGILAEELFFDASDPTLVKGFQDRYQSYRQAFSRISGDFYDTLNYWTFTRNFDTEPELNSAFVSAEDIPLLPFADQVNDHLLVMCKHHVYAKRKVSKFASYKVL